VFAWSYDDLKSYKGDIIQHTIPLKEDAKPFRKTLGRINLKLLPLIKKELENMLFIKIVAPTHHSSWLVNLVVVRTKIGEIRLCIDFRNLNQLSLKYNYSFPNT
jgi:hypothetical protein